MRDAFGGVFSTTIMLVFIVILVAFAAISLNYAKAFKVKNSLIDFVEQQEITDLENYYRRNRSTFTSKIDAILDNADYNRGCIQSNNTITYEPYIPDREPGEPYSICYRGVVIKESDTVGNVITYTINTYAGWELSSLNMLLRLAGENDPTEVAYGTWKITGKAKVIKVN